MEDQAFTALRVRLALLLVILARMFQTKFKAHFPPRSVPQPWAAHSHPGRAQLSRLSSREKGWSASRDAEPSF